LLSDISLLIDVLKQLQRKRVPVRGSEILAKLPGMTEEDIYSLLSNGVLKPYASGADIQDHKFLINSTDMPPLPRQRQAQISDNSTVVATIPFKEFAPIRGLKSLYAELCRLIIGSDVEISIINPFFDRDGQEKMVTYLEGALDRGVDVRILSRGKVGGQARTFIRPLKSRGKEAVDVRMLPRGRETAVHAKLLIADSKSAYVGSANLTGRSLASNLELGVILTGSAASILANLFDQLWTLSISC
jgi:phosphatidylserine/phosphatidylglycerophosphate/cardiolipin synthase-like enzyme